MHGFFERPQLAEFCCDFGVDQIEGNGFFKAAGLPHGGNDFPEEGIGNQGQAVMEPETISHGNLREVFDSLCIDMGNETSRF